MRSAFLPKNFNSTLPLAVIAGKGEYPKILIHRAKQCGVTVKLVGFEGETDQDLINQFAPNDREIIKVGQLGRLLKVLKRFNVGYAIMVGQITPRKLFKGLHPDFKALTLLAKMKLKNAETLFGQVANEIEDSGVRVLDARAFMDEDVVAPGALVGKFKEDEAYLQHGIEMAKYIAEKDIGQGVVVSRGTVLAVEGFDGTDALLKRVGDMGAKGMIFAKVAKRNQDYRFDVPVFGERTLRAMAENNIPYAGLEAEKLLVLNKDKVIIEAKKLGITLVGV